MFGKTCSTFKDEEKNIVINECVKILDSKSEMSLNIPAAKCIYYLVKIQQGEKEKNASTSLQFFQTANGFDKLLPHIDSSNDILRLLILKIYDSALTNEEARNQFIKQAGLSSMNSVLAHWDTRIRQMGLHILFRLVRNVNAEAILQSELILHVASLLYYVPETVERSLAADILLDISQIPDGG